MTIDVTISGTIDSFDVDVFIQRLASSLDVMSSQISVQVSPASVNVLATIVDVDEEIMETIATLTQTPTAFETATGVTVELIGPSAIHRTVLDAPSPPPYSPIQVNDGVLQGGNVAGAQDFPFIVLLLSCWDLQRCAMCSASLVGNASSPFVLTAKHCVDMQQLRYIRLYACGEASAYPDPNTGMRDESKRIQPYGDSNLHDVVYIPSRSTPASPDQMYRTTSPDVALIPIRPESVPSCAAFAPIAPSASKGDLVDLIGYGYDGTSQTSGILQYLENLPIARIWSSGSAWRSASTGMSYSYGQDIRMDSARYGIRRGDSGGPMLDRDGRVVGVASYGSMNFAYSGHAGLVNPGMSRWMTEVFRLPPSQHVPSANSDRSGTTRTDSAPSSNQITTSGARSSRSLHPVIACMTAILLWSVHSAQSTR